MSHSDIATSAPPSGCQDAYGLTPLLHGAVAGDRDALDNLLAKLRPYLHVLVRARLGHDSAIDRSALVQESLVRIYQHIAELKQLTVPCLLGWVGQIARNLVIDALRAKQREPARATNSRLIELFADSLSSEHPQDRDRRALRVAEALEQLKERRRQVIEMFFLEQLSDAEICRRIGGSAGAIRVLRFRALEDLRRLLAADADSECSRLPHAITR